MKGISEIYYIVLLVLLPAVIFSQNKKQASVTDFNKWYVMQGVKISNKAEWIAYKKTNSGDSLYLKDTKKGAILVLSDVQAFDFSPTRELLAIRVRNKLKILVLKNNNVIDLNGEGNFAWTNDGNKLVWYNTHSLGIYDLKTAKVTEITKIEHIALSENKKWFVYSRSCEKSGSCIYVMNVESGFSEFIVSNISNFFAIKFDNDAIGFSCGFEDELGIKQIVMAVFENGKWKTEKTNFNNEVQWNGGELFNDLKNKRLFFYASKAKNVEDDTYNKQIVYNSLIENRNHEKEKYYEWSWSNIEILLVNKNLDEVVPTSLPNIHIGYDTSPYDLRDNNGIAYADFYLLSKGTPPELIVQKVELLSQHFLIAPHQYFTVYYKDGYWWSFDLKSRITKRINVNNPFQFENQEKKYLSSTGHYGFMGWSESEYEILVYDSNDIWALSLEGKYELKLTNGRNKDVVYRTVTSNPNKVNYFRNSLFKPNLINTTDFFAIEGKIKNTEKINVELIKKLKKNVVLRPFRQERILQVKKVDRNYLIKSESSDVPPKYTLVNHLGRELWMVASNEHQKEFLWNRSEMIYDDSNTNHLLRGALIYPSDWDPSKKYPMIIYLYEQIAHWINHYTLPIFKNTNGFNKTIFSQNGFFVFLPDLKYKRNEFGAFLSNDINLLINAANKKEPTINIDKLGIMGHSFGAYQVMYLLGQNNRFKAGVAGAGVSDLYDRYYSNNEKGNLGMFVFENMQYHSDEAYRNENFDNYNPLKFVRNINTPLLLWSGENDEQVKKEHSEKMYYALWRQKKEAILTIYKNEGHVLSKPENQKELTSEIVEWFEKKLK